jgi:hypothetical protein
VVALDGAVADAPTIGRVLSPGALFFPTVLP